MTMTTPRDVSIDLGHQALPPASVDITDPKDVDFWTRQFGVSELELRRAVADAGVVVVDVRDYLGAARGTAGA